MNIAVTTVGSTLESPVFAEFAHAPYLLIVDMESMTCTPIHHATAPGSDCTLARTILEHRCEAVITGQLTADAFAVLADAMVTRFRAGTTSAHEALVAMEQRQLELIRNPDGSDTCSGDHHHD